MKLTIVLPDLVDGFEVKAGVRHVRTPEGRAKYGQPIGSVITRDSIERAKRRRPGGSGSGSAGSSGSTQHRKRPGLSIRTTAGARASGAIGTSQSADAAMLAAKPSAHPAPVGTLTGAGRPDGAGTTDDPVDVKGDIDLAVRLLGEGKRIRLNRPDEVGTLVRALHDIVKDARSKGADAPTYDLCKVSVPGTNLFCAEHKGIPRVQMPQIAGVPQPGSKAEAIARSDPGRVSPNGKIDLSPEFRQALGGHGVAIQKRSVPTSHLRASQMELDGATVAALPEAFASGAVPRDAPVFSTRGGYILDGHHRWAARVYEDVQSGNPGDTTMSTEEVDMDIGAAIDFASGFARDMGIGAESVGGAPDPDRATRTIDTDGITTEVRAGELEVGDRVLLPDSVGRLQPAELTRVGIDGFGDFSLDYRWSDGSEEAVALDRSEIVRRLDRLTPPEPDLDVVVEPEAVSVTAGAVRPGDRIAAEDGTSLLVFGRARERATGLWRVSTVDENGKRDSALYPDGYGFELASVASAPEELPAGTVTGRPVLATYQRRAIAAMDLEAGGDPVLAQAAARVRTRQPLSAQQAAALATELRRRAEEERQPATKRSLSRASAQVGATVTDLGGEFTPDQVQRTGATRVGTADIAEGDQIAVAGPEGVTVGKVTARRPVLGGRLTELTLSDGTGVDRTVMLSRSAPAYLLPDLPDPEPVPEPTPPVGSEEVVDYASVRLGDRVRLPALGSETPIEGVVVDKRSEEGEGEDGPVPGTFLSIRHTTADGNTVVSGWGLYGTDTLEVLERGVEVVEPEPAVERSREAAEIESEMHRLAGARPMEGRIFGVSHGLADDRTSMAALAELLRSRSNPIVGAPNNYPEGGSLARVLSADADADVQRSLQSAMSDVLVQARTNYAERVAQALEDWPYDESQHSFMGHVEQVLASTPPPDFTRAADALAQAGAELRTRQAAGIGYTAPTDEQRTAAKVGVEVALKAQRKEFASRMIAVVKGKDLRTAYNDLASFGNAQPTTASAESVRRIVAAGTYGIDPGQARSVGDRIGSDLKEHNNNLLAEVLAELAGRKDNDTRSPESAVRSALKKRDALKDGFETDWWMAGSVVALTEMRLAAGGDGTSTAPEPELPAPDFGQDLGARMRQLRALLPEGGAQFGSKRMRVTTFAPTTLAELEAGNAPEIVLAEVYRRDTEPDGGPGESALRQLEVIRTAGRELDARMRVRLEELTRDLPPIPVDGGKGSLAPAMEAYAEYRRLFDAHQDEIATRVNSASWTVMIREYANLRLHRGDTAEEEARFTLLAKAVEEGNARPPDAELEFQRYERLIKAASGSAPSIKEAKQAHARARSQAALEVLSSVREMGEGKGAKVSFKKKEGASVPVMRWAVQFYPRDWIRTSEQKRKRAINLKTAARGFSTSRNKNGEPEIALSKGNDQMGMGATYEEYRNVAVHEFGHQMEDTIPGLSFSEWALLWDRTSEGGPGARTRTGDNALTHIYSGNSKEVGRKDKFPLHYTGKVYDSTDRNFEVFTTAVESLFAGSDYLDEDLRQWTLGTMALI